MLTAEREAEIRGLMARGERLSLDDAIACMPMVIELLAELDRLRAIVAAGVVGDEEKAHVRRMARADAFAEAYEYCHGYFNYPELLEWLQQREVAEYDGPAERKESGDAG
jgi:hypothetical protein